MADGAVQTLIRKITIGTPIRKVTGAAAQKIGDLTDVNTSNLQDDGLLQYNLTAAKFEVTTEPEGLDIFGGEF